VSQEGKAEFQSRLIILRISILIKVICPQSLVRVLTYPTLNRWGMQVSLLIGQRVTQRTNDKGLMTLNGEWLPEPHLKDGGASPSRFLVNND